MKKTNNKGFSLVELIIVIAIMAILIGVLAPQYIKYVEKSRVSADTDLLDSVYKACSVAASDPEITDGPIAGADVQTIEISDDATEGFDGAVLATLGVTSIDQVEAKLKSKTAKEGDDETATIAITMDTNGNFKVVAGDITVPAQGTTTENDG